MRRVREIVSSRSPPAPPRALVYNNSHAPTRQSLRVLPIRHGRTRKHSPKDGGIATECQGLPKRLLVDGYETHASGKADKTSDIIDVETFHQASTMKFDGLGAEAERSSDVLGAFALGHQF